MAQKNDPGTPLPTSGVFKDGNGEVYPKVESSPTEVSPPFFVESGCSGACRSMRFCDDFIS